MSIWQRVYHVIIRILIIVEKLFSREIQSGYTPIHSRWIWKAVSKRAAITHPNHWKVNHINSKSETPLKSGYIPLNPYLRFYIFSLYPTLSAIYSQPQKTHSTHFNQSSTPSRSRFLATALEKPSPPLGSVPRPRRRTARHGRSADLPPTIHDMDPGLPGKHRKNR